MEIRVEHVPGELQVIVRGPKESEELLRVLALLECGTKKLWARDEDGGLVALQVQDIVWCELVDDKAFVYTRDAIYRTSLSLAELASHWERAGLFRCSRSAVVNLWAICHLKSRPGGRIEATLATGERLMISRHYAPLLRERIGQEGSGCVYI